MTAFTALAALLVIVALGFLLWPLLRVPRAAASVEAANLSIYRDQFAELERDLRLGVIDGAQYDASRAELQRRLLDEAGDKRPVVPATHAASRTSALIIALAVPVMAGVLYWRLGEPQALDPARRAPQQDATDITQEQFEAMTQQLADRLQANPQDAEGWAMLGRAYKALGRLPDAVKAFGEANQRAPGVPELLVEYAEALAQVHGKLSGEPRKLLEQALKIAPNDPKALTLAGGAAFEAGDYRRAIGYWQRVAATVPADSELGKALATGIARAEAMAGGKAGPAPAQTAAAPRVVRGEIRLAPTLKERASPDDTVFIFARAAEGPRMPLAVLRKQVRDLPASFQLDDTMAMNPELQLSSVPRVIVTARISRSGGATPQSGDLQGESQPVTPGSGAVSITIDRVLP
jgi:cytochrome c-type biogenesis protein CcmH